MTKWKAEIWMEDTPPEEEVGDNRYLTQKELNIAMEMAKAAIEGEWEGLEVIDFDVYIDKEDDLSKREGL